MKLMNQLDKLVKNQVVLYGVLILTVTNVFGYLMTANYEAIVFFSLVYYLSHEFTKNNILVCLIALGSTNLLLTIVQGRKIYESFVEGEEHEKKDDKKGGKKDAKKGDKKDAKKDGKKDDKKKEEEKDGFQIDGFATQQANKKGLAGKMDGSKLQEHMGNLDKIENLISKQEGLVGSLGKIEGMMERLEKMNSTINKGKKETAPK